MFRRPLTAVAAALALTVSVLVTPAAAAQATTDLSLRASSTELLEGERVYLDGHLTSDGDGLAGQKVIAQRRVPGATTWEYIRTVTTSSSGHYTYIDRPKEDMQYRAVVQETSNVARAVATITVEVGSSPERKLYQRVAQVGRFMGDPVGDLVHDGVYTYQRYDAGVLVKVNRRASLGDRVWQITGRMYSTWSRLGGLDSKLRHPVNDVKCDLLEGGCLQRFAGGSLYYSDTVGMTIQYGVGPWTDVAVVAKSQVGYKEPAWRDSKYNAWIGDDNAWCGVFQGWIFAASDNGDLVPAEARFSQFVIESQKHMTVVKNPRPGDIALMDFTHIGNATTPTHAAFVKRVDGRYLITYEGNTTSGTGDLTRGVWHRKRSASLVVVYLRPDW